MTKLNTAAPARGKSYEPAPFLGALPLPSSDASAERWRTSARTLFNPTLSSYFQNTPPSRHELPERLFDALAIFKRTTAMLATGHITSQERDRLFAKLDSLLHADSWDRDDIVTTEASFTTLLRIMLYLDGRPPALGATGTGNFIATWTEGNDRLTIECQPDDHVRWVLVQSLDGQRESAAGETTARRLPEVLRPYDPPKRWFPHATDQAPA